MVCSIDSLTIGEAKDFAALFGGQSREHSLKIGEKYFIRTVRGYYTGLLVSITASDLVLADAAWIAHTGRLAAALEKGSFQSVEPFPADIIINRDSIVDASIWEHELPRHVK